MVANKFVAIYYFSDTKNYNSSLKSFFQKHGVELCYETNLCRLLSKTVAVHPMMVVVDNIPKQFITQFLQLFDIESPFYVPSVCCLQNEKEKSVVGLPYNCVLCDKDDYEVVLSNKINECLAYKNNPHNTSNFPLTRFDIITKVLRNIGVNVKSCGSIFLKDCINQVIIDGCKACTLYNSVYSIVAAMHSTTINNLERCMRTAISSAWQLYNKDNTSHIFNNDILFTTKPTVKEFIYYVANFVKDKECEDKVQWLVNGVCRQSI